MPDTAQAPAEAQQPPWDPIGAARAKFPGLQSEPDEKVGGFLSQPENFRTSFPEYSHLDDETIHRNMATRMVPTEKQAAASPPRPQLIPSKIGLGGHAGDPNRRYTPEKQAFGRAALKEAGSETGIPLTIGARALESYAKNKDVEQLQNAARGTQRQIPAPPEAGIADTGGTVPDEDRTKQFLARSGADILRGAAGMVTPQSEAIALAAPFAPTIVGTGLALHGGYNAAKEAPQAFRGNPDATRNMLNAAAEATGGAAMGKAGVEAGAPDVKAVLRAPKAAIRTVGEPYTVGLSGEQMLTKGISPRASATGFKESLARASGDIKAYHNETPIKNVQDLDDAIPEIKQKIWKGEVEPALARNATRPVDMRPVAQAVRDQIGPEMREFDESNATKLDELADKLEKARDVESGNRLLKYVNGQLESYFSKYPSARRSNLMNNPETAGWEAARSSLRQQFLQTLEDAGEKGVREARLRYGALEDVGKEVERRVNVADRAKPMSLPRILGLFGAPVTGGLSIAAGEAAHYLNKPDTLVRRGVARLPESTRTIDVSPEVPPSAAPPPTSTPPLPPQPAPTPKPVPTKGVMKGVREVMARTPTTSRATPTGDAATLPAELHAELEKQAGRKLSPPEAMALDRANLERGMATGKAGETGAIREEHRAKLEQAGRPEPVKMPPAKVTPRSESLKTYNSLSAEQKAVVDGQVSELPHMPQALREGRMKQLENYGGKGSFLKERLAKEVLEDMPETGEKPKPQESSLENRAEISRLQKRERELNEQSARARNWVRANQLGRQAHEAHERWQAIKRGIEREPGQD